MRTQSEFYSPIVGLLLDKLSTDAHVSIEEYRDTFYQIGNELAIVLNQFIQTSDPTMLACASEDADWLASGLLNRLEVNDPALAVFWTDRIQFDEDHDIVVSPIVKSYIENINNCQTLIIVKSIIVTSCVVKTQLSRLIENINPTKIYIVAPIMFKGAEQKLRDEFPLNISSKFSFISFAIDDQINDEGVVIPGIGGMIYSRLGLINIDQKNKYIPEIVKQRRELSFF